jgi:hypothetical protein
MVHATCVIVNVISLIGCQKCWHLKQAHKSSLPACPVSLPASSVPTNSNPFLFK